MSLSLDDLRVMVAAASTIPERLSSHYLPDNGRTRDELIQVQLDAWCRVAAAGDWQRFQERLSWDGLDIAGARRLLAPGMWSNEVPLPAWTTTLLEALNVLEAVPDVIVAKSQYPFLDAARPLPFEELLAPFVGIACQHLFDQVGAISHLLADAAHLTLERHLLQVLTSLSLPTLHQAFEQVRTQAQKSALSAGSSEQFDEQGLYRHFLRRMCRGGLATLLRSQSVLARLLATTCDCWVAANVEFVQRLAADWAAIEEAFGAGSELGQVTEIEPALSDAHMGQRTVMGLTFASGLKLIYKPCSVGMEEAYNRLLDWCNTRGATPPFKILTILNGTTYGWVEFVACEPCQDIEALWRYYQRAGMLTCLIYVSGGVDCLYDHFIAHNEYPVLIDPGVLLHPYFSPHSQERWGEDWEQEQYSVLHTGLLASWQSRPSGTVALAVDISGLGMIAGRDGSAPDNGGTKGPPQHVTLKYGMLKPRAPLHIAVSITGQLREEELQAAICTGFQQMYRLLLEERPALLAPDSPLQAFKTQSARVTYRDRATYDALLPRLLAPQALRDALTRSMLLENLGLDSVPVEWYVAGKRDRANWWKAFAAEREALLRGDVPLVTARADSDALLIDRDCEVSSCLCQPAFDLLLARLERLSNTDMHLQLALLRRALDRQTTPLVFRRESVRQVDKASNQSEALLTQVLAIADDIASRAIEVGEGGVLWTNTSYSLRVQHLQLQPMRYSFSQGVSGIAFFLAAVAQSTGIADYGRLALAAVRPLHRLLRDEGERLAREMGLGAGYGLGSVIYALTRVSQFLDEPELLADARVAASLITPERIAEDNIRDVFLGAAGAILGLLALYDAAPQQDVLDRAVWCGQYLLRVRTPSAADCRAWPTVGGKHYTGFAHGTAGIVYALVRLYARTGDSDFLEAAREALRYEDRAFVSEKGNWLEEIGTGEPDFRTSWCHGAPGIGLARLGGLSMLDSASIRRDIEAALQTTQQIGCVGVDHLCCGASGRAELFLTAARRLARPELAGVALDFMEQVLTRARQREVFLINPVLPRWVPQPQLFQGVSGIGYTLLRLARSDALPSALLWE